MFSFHHVLAGLEHPQAIIDSKHFFVLSHLSGPQPKGFFFLGFGFLFLIKCIEVHISSF